MTAATGGGPSIPSARRAVGSPESRVASGASAGGPGAGPPTRRKRLTWDIPWLGGRSTAPWVVLATVLILLLAGLGALYAKHKPDRLGYNTETFRAVSDTAADLTFSVYKAPSAVASCDIVAADEQGTVGTLPAVIVPARTDGSENTRLTVTVPTTRRAATVILDSCHVVSSG